MAYKDNKVDLFLNNYGMHPNSIDMDECCKAFVSEMEHGLISEGSSLMMIPTYISAEGDLPENTTVIAMDAGGTNFRVALVYFNNNETDIQNYMVYPMPGADIATTKKEFLQKICSYLSPVIEKSDKIGFCFSYPAEILPNKDGRLIKFNKEVQIAESENMEICAEIMQALKENGIQENKRFVLINDTVAALLGGKAAVKDRIYDGYIGFILGTGTNSCYCEKIGNIKLCDSLFNADSMIINIESGGYGRMPVGRLEKDFDDLTNDPGDHIFEKMVAGGYKPGIIMFTVKRAANEGLFSAEFENKINGIDHFTMGDIDSFCSLPYGDNPLAKLCSDENDVETLYQIIDRNIEKSAKMAAVNIAAILLKADIGKSPYKPACVVMEGSFYYKSILLKKKLDYYIKEYINDSLGRYVEFVKVENANLSGAALAALLNTVI